MQHTVRPSPVVSLDRQPFREVTSWTEEGSLGLCWRHWPPVCAYLGPGLVSGRWCKLYCHVLSGPLPVLGWSVWLLDKRRPQRKAAPEVEWNIPILISILSFKNVYSKPLIASVLGKMEQSDHQDPCMSLSSCLVGNLTAIKIRPSLKQQGLGRMGLPLIRQLGDRQNESILSK